VPHASASIIVRPKGSGQSIGKSSAAAPPTSACLSRSPISPRYSTSGCSSQVVGRLGLEGVEVARQAVVDRAGPAQPRQRRALGVRDRGHRLLAVLAVDRIEPCEIEAAVERGQDRQAATPREGVEEMVEMVVDDVELVRACQRLLRLEQVHRGRIERLGREPQRLGRACDERARGQRVRAREERHVVPHRDERVGQVGDDALRASVPDRGDTLEQGRELGDAHTCLLWLRKPQNLHSKTRAAVLAAASRGSDA
jgi:hypothetical protein